MMNTALWTELLARLDRFAEAVEAPDACLDGGV